MTKKAAVINDLSGFGKCSLTAAIPVLSVLGIQCCPLPTAVLTGQTGYSYYHCNDLTEMMPRYTDAWAKNEVSFDAIYSGYMTGPKQIRYLLDFLSVFQKEDTFFLADPVMGDEGRVYGMYSLELLSEMRTLCKRANLITPNLTEACLLLNEDLTVFVKLETLGEQLSYAEKLAYALRSRVTEGADIVITGIHGSQTAEPLICNLALTETGVHISRTPYLKQGYSGTGDLFASILCGLRLNGVSTNESVDTAASFLYRCISDAVSENIPKNDGVCFEKHLGELIKGGLYYDQKH